MPFSKSTAQISAIKQTIFGKLSFAFIYYSFVVV
jgi:hypothetical protein